MAITIRHATNMALQYNSDNEIILTDYLMSDARTAGKFLTESPQFRSFHMDEKGALYFLSDDETWTGEALYLFKDRAGNVLNAETVELVSTGVHNSVPVLSPLFFVPTDTYSVSVQIMGDGGDHMANGDFSGGSGNNFDSWTETGDILQSVNGGISGSRAALINDLNVSATKLSQTRTLDALTTYVIRFFAKNNDGLFSTLKVTIDGVTQDVSLTPTFQYYELSFTMDAVPDNLVSFQHLTESFSGYALLDNVTLFTSGSEISEERVYQLDQNCYASGFTVDWLNKLGGRDSFYFTGGYQKEKTVNRETMVELSLSNFASPNRIYGYREHISSKSYTLHHRCKNKDTAVWLKDELIDSIDVMLVIGGYHYPVNVQGTEITTDNSADLGAIISFKFKLAFDVNIQTR